jgi:hypothetical protein
MPAAEPTAEPTSELAPRSLTDWLQVLEPKPLPVDDRVRNTALQLLEQGGTATALAPVLLRDPALVVLLFREANQALARYDREAHTLEHAISLLGVGRVQNLLEQAPTLAPDHPQAEAYRLKLLRSRHAAAQAQLWAEGTGLWPGEEVFWATLLAAAPMWLLWLEAGALLHKIDLFRAKHGAVGKKQVHELFGCDSYEVAAALAVCWRLPTLSQLGWQRAAIGSQRQWIALEHSAHLDESPTVPDRALTELCHHPALIVALANALAAEADWDWYSRRSQRLLRIAATACRRPLATIISYCHQSAAAISHDYGDCAGQSPGAKLLCHWQQAHCWFKPLPAPQAEPVATPNSADRILAAAVQKLRNPAAVGGVREALTLGLQALHAGIGFARAAILFVKPSSQELQTVLSAGTEQHPALRQFRGAAQNNPLLTQLLSKPVCLLVDRGNRDKYLYHLPESFRAAIDCDNFVLMAVFAGTRPVALIYADIAPRSLDSGTRQHTLFKQLCQTLSQTLTQLG